MPLVPGVKITVPQLPPEFVVRSELCAELDGGVPADVVLVCAPAGYGKTLLLADWSRTRTAVDTAWVGLDRDDNDPKRLWHPLWPRSPAARRCRSTVGCTTRGPGSAVPDQSSSPSSPTHCRHCRGPSA